MGNKQTVFTHEQLEAYQVGVMCGAALVSWPEEWGQHPFILGGQSARVPGAALCVASAEMSMGRRGEEAWVRTGPSQCLSPQDCTFFTRKEIMRSVWGGREEDPETAFYTVLEDVWNLTKGQCFMTES